MVTQLYSSKAVKPDSWTSVILIRVEGAARAVQCRAARSGFFLDRGPPGRAGKDDNQPGQLRGQEVGCENDPRASIRSKSLTTLAYNFGLLTQLFKPDTNGLLSSVL